MNRTTGTVRNLDDLGRVVIPRDMRRRLDLRANEPLEITSTQDTIVIRKYNMLLDLRDKHAKSACLAFERQCKAKSIAAHIGLFDSDDNLVAATCTDFAKMRDTASAVNNYSCTFGENDPLLKRRAILCAHILIESDPNNIVPLIVDTLAENYVATMTAETYAVL